MRIRIKLWGPIAAIALAAVTMTGCGAGVQVVSATSTSAVVPAKSPGSSSSHAVTDHGLRLSVPTQWQRRDRTGAVAQADLASIVFWREGGSGQTPADVLLVHEKDAAPRPGADVSVQRERDAIGQGIASFAADPRLVQQFAQTRGHGCFTGFQTVRPPTRWEQSGFVGLQLEWICTAEVPAHGWAMIAFDPAGVKHRVTITSPVGQWNSRQAELDAVRRSLTATATAPASSAG